MNVLPKQTPAQEWQAMRLIRLLYVRLAREFALNAPPCDELDAGIDVPSKEDMAAGRQWQYQMDELIQVHQLRQYLQTTTGVNEETLIAMVQHLVAKAVHNESDRDKVDFLLVQFLTQTSPAKIEESAVTMGFVTNGLEMVLGKVSEATPASLSPLEGLIVKAKTCSTLNQLFGSGVLEKGRKLKVEAGENYFTPIALIAFARFNFILRRVFFRLMHEDINAILDGLRELESQGVETLDGTIAQFSAQEPIMQLRMICQSWKLLFQAEYSLGQPMQVLADLRTVVESALGTETTARRPEWAGLKARAAAASATVSGAPEFEVSNGDDRNSTES
jgi:hypothetical protein